MSTDIAEHLAELASAEYKRSATGSQLAFEAIKDATDTQRMREDIAEAQALRAKAFGCMESVEPILDALKVRSARPHTCTFAHARTHILICTRVRTRSRTRALAHLQTCGVEIESFRALWELERHCVLEVGKVRWLT